MLEFFRFFSSLPSEAILVVEFLTCLTFIGLFHRFFGRAGLYVYTSLAVIIANIQVLRLGMFSFALDPVALGTVVFTSTYFVADIITERYGVHEAKKVIGISFLAMAFVPICMGLTLSFPALKTSVYDQAIQVLFSPIPRLMVASFISYGISQYLDIHLFQKIKNLTHTKYLGLRSIVSLMSSAFIDNVLFCTLAWVILAPEPVSWHTLWYSYILGTYIIRLGVTCLFAPCLYFFRKSS